jgi:hypothetical protein
MRSIGIYLRLLWGIILGSAALAVAGLSGSYLVPLDHEAIQYSKRPVHDPVYRLGQKIVRGETQLDFDESHGYLRSLLAALDVPVESQVLVFAKTSFQAPLISPRKPRAIYFNDRVAVGTVRGSDMLEIVAQDPQLGSIFYTLTNEQAERPRFERRDDACLQCHQAGVTLGVPGLVVRSIYPESSGMPLFQAGGFVTDHRSPLQQRWGGWYVTGTSGSVTHMGNRVARDPDHPEKLDAHAAFSADDLERESDAGHYLSPHSDIVALMTLEHQTRMSNLITRVSFETLLALHDRAILNQALGLPAAAPSESTTRRIDSAVEEMVEYMLFLDEAPLEAPVLGTSGFARTFSRLGPRDRKGRSLRDFDLTTRLFRYPLTYMIYSEAFDSMPPAALDSIYRKLFDVLTGKEKKAPFTRMREEDRRAILQILLATKPSLPDYWRQVNTASSK